MAILPPLDPSEADALNLPQMKPVDLESFLASYVVCVCEFTHVPAHVRASVRTCSRRQGKRKERWPNSSLSKILHPPPPPPPHCIGTATAYE